jgi:hypothetical protein
MYSDGKTVADTYCVHYAVGDTPFGPFKEAPGGRRHRLAGRDRRDRRLPLPASGLPRRRQGSSALALRMDSPLK